MTRQTSNPLVFHECCHMVAACATHVLACKEPPELFTAVVTGEQGVSNLEHEAFNCAVTVIIENHRARVEGLTLKQTCVSPEDVAVAQTLEARHRPLAMRLGAWLAYSGTVQHVATDLPDDAGLIAVNGEQLFKALRPRARRVADPAMHPSIAAKVPKPIALPTAYVQTPFTPDQMNHVRRFLADTTVLGQRN